MSKMLRASLLCFLIAGLAFAGIAYGQESKLADTNMGKIGVLAVNPQPDLQFYANEKIMMKLTYDGRLWLNPECTTEEIAKRLIEIYEEHFTNRLNDLRHENARLKAKIERLEGGAK